MKPEERRVIRPAEYAIETGNCLESRTLKRLSPLPFGVDKNCSFDWWSSIGLMVRRNKGDAKDQPQRLEFASAIK